MEWISILISEPNINNTWWSDDVLVTDGKTIWVDSLFGNPDRKFKEHSFWSSRREITHWRILPEKPFF